MIRCTGKKIKVISKRKMYHAIAWLLAAIGTAGPVAAIVFQLVLRYQLFGTISEKVFIPHWSFGLLGTLLLYIPATIIYYILGGD